ncbi:hypothetical protein RBWH47_05504 [Rhodopirellula baltica WH47]|uniref:Uncharacterized protein n=2 Tax=Rhodopirellula baltica TaxID=265606 RepID=F2AMJ0_RHOBT|nr:hypothetical protein RBWH47_05504 [Rhodopirellula baltica WH47]
MSVRSPLHEVTDVMTNLPLALVWLLFLLFAIPLAGMAWNARQQSRAVAQVDLTPKTTYEGPVIDNGDGTRSQKITVSVVTSVSTSQTVQFGPFAVQVHFREWAANAVLMSIVLLGIGLIGLLHFPDDSPTTEWPMSSETISAPFDD